MMFRHPLRGYDSKTWVLFMVMGLLVQVLGWMLINYAQGHIPATIISPTLLAQPVITALFAAMLLGERFTPWYMGGGIMVILGVLLVHRSRSKKQTDHPNDNKE
jgi:drug/metabolite transporter (DMT)-like permease